MWIAHSVWHSHRKYRVSLHRACARHSSLSAHLAPRHSPSNLHPQLTLHAVQTWATASPLAILLPILGSVHEGQELLRKSTVASSFFPPAGGLEPENVLSVEGGPAFPSPALPALDLALLYPADGLCQAKCPLSPFCASLASLFALWTQPFSATGMFFPPFSAYWILVFCSKLHSSPTSPEEASWKWSLSHSNSVKSSFL
jgi:hypothetical protein